MSKGKKVTGVFGPTAGVVGLALLAFVTPVAHVAEAADAPSSEPCPTREATLSAVNALLGDSSSRPDDLAQIEVTDLGNRFAITIKGRTREYTEPARNCAQRARMAAVFVALTLAPPDIGESIDEPMTSEPQRSNTEASAPAAAASSAASSPLPHRAAPPPRATTNPRSEWHAELDVAAQVAFDAAQPTVAPGALARAALRRGAWGVALGVDVPAHGSWELRGLRVNQSRYTADLALQRNWVFGATRVNISLGPSLTLLQLKQATEPDTERATHYLAGLRAGVYWTLAEHCISPFLGGYLQLVPYRIPITVEPEGKIGKTSIVWFGATIGLALGTD